MVTAPYITDLRIVGGDLSLDFLNTLNGPRREPATFDCLQTYEDVVAWGHSVGVVSATGARRMFRSARERARDAGAAHRETLALRARLYELFGAIARGRPPPSRRLDDLREAERAGLARAKLVRAGQGYSWRWTDHEDLRSVMWPIVHAATELVTSDKLARIKSCAGCRWIFLDTSRNGRRRWCTMEVCGTHEKSRRYVARRAADRRASAEPKSL